MPDEQCVVPTLSICIPTYNRSASLRNLFRSLREVKSQFGSDIEICISNNASPDDTAAVIAEQQALFDLHVVHQERNVGATLNIIAVTKMMSGRWGLLVGDDDELIPAAVGELLSYLKTIANDSWVLVDSLNLDGGLEYLGQFADGEYSSAEFRRLLLTKGMYVLSFMGVNVFPQSAVPTFGALTVEIAQPWPQIAVLVRLLLAAEQQVYIVKKAIVAQAKGGAVLFWNGGDLARIKLGKIRVLMHVWKERKRRYFYLHAMMLRELLESHSIRALLAWKLYEGADYDRTAVSTYLRCYRWLGLCMPLSIPHAVLMFTLRVVPHSWYAKCLSLAGMGHLLARYQTLKSELGMFDAIKRGL